MPAENVKGASTGIFISARGGRIKLYARGLNDACAGAGIIASVVATVLPAIMFVAALTATFMAGGNSDAGERNGGEFILVPLFVLLCGAVGGLVGGFSGGLVGLVNHNSAGNESMGQQIGGGRAE